MLNMFQITVWPNLFRDRSFANAAECMRRVCENRTLSQELRDLLELRKGEIDFVDEEVDLGFDCPLSLHCQYTRDQIFCCDGSYGSAERARGESPTSRTRPLTCL